MPFRSPTTGFHGSPGQIPRWTGGGAHLGEERRRPLPPGNGQAFRAHRGFAGLCRRTTGRRLRSNRKSPGGREVPDIAEQRQWVSQIAASQGIDHGKSLPAYRDLRNLAGVGTSEEAEEFSKATEQFSGVGSVTLKGSLDTGVLRVPSTALGSSVLSLPVQGAAVHLMKVLGIHQEAPPTVSLVALHNG